MPNTIAVALANTIGPGQTLVASAARTTQGASGALDCDGYACLSALVSVTTGGLTVTSFRVWLQGSMDAGVTWFGLVHTNVLKILGLDSLSVAAGNMTVNSPSLALEVGNVTGTTAYFGCVNNPPPLVRAVWEINGTVPSETFSITAYLSKTLSN